MGFVQLLCITFHDNKNNNNKLSGFEAEMLSNTLLVKEVIHI